MADVWLDPYEIDLIEGSIETKAIKIANVDSVSSIEVSAYLGRVDATSILFPSGSPSSNGNIITLPPLNVPSDKAGSTYVVCVKYVTGADTQKRKFQVNVISKTQAKNG